MRDVNLTSRVTVCYPKKTVQDIHTFDLHPRKKASSSCKNAASRRQSLKKYPITAFLGRGVGHCDRSLSEQYDFEKKRVLRKEVEKAQP